MIRSPILVLLAVLALAGCGAPKQSNSSAAMPENAAAAPDQTAIGVYAPEFPVPSGVTPLMLDGRALLWSIARAPSESIRALIAAAIDVMRAARDA